MQTVTGRSYANLPNLLTYGRIAAVPVLVGLLLLETYSGRWLAFSLFLLAGISDYFDGMLARMWNQQSSLGRMLDPIADKLLVAACLLLLCYDQTIFGVHVWAALIILAREILVSGLREYLAELRVSIPVTKLAKWKTAVQFLAIAVLLTGTAGDVLFVYTTTIGLAALWIAALLTLYTGYDYFRAGLKHVIGDE